MGRALITGGSGFLGNAIRMALHNHGHDVLVFDRFSTQGAIHIQGDILDRDALIKAMKGVDIVFHIAGVLGTSELTQDNVKAIDVNIKGTINVLEAAKTAGVKRVFYPTKPNEWLNTYSITKKAGEDFVQMFQALGHLEVRVLRWLNAYGPMQKLTPVRKAVPMFIVAALENEPLTIWGRGEQPVDLIYTEDLAKITVEHTLSDNVDSRVYDTGLTTRMTVNCLADMIIELCQSSSSKEHREMRVGEYENIPVQLLRGSTAADILGCTDQMTPIREGMLKTIDYYKGLSRAVRQEALRYYDGLYCKKAA